MRCQNNTSRCLAEAAERITTVPTATGLPSLTLDLCHGDAAIWASVLTKRGREFERVNLETGERERHEEEIFQRTARVGRGKARK